MRVITGALLGALCCAGLGLAEDKKPAAPGQPAANKGPRFDADRFLKDHDRNTDGKLSKDELPADIQASFDKIDTNKDGFITADELRNHAAMIMRQRPQVVEILYYVIDIPEEEPISVQELQQAYDVLRKLDTNGDGKLDPQEINAYRKQRQEERVTAVLSAMDRNNDGKISKDEARGLWADDFAQLDKNGDGFLDRQEIEQAFRINQTADAAAPKAK